MAVNRHWCFTLNNPTDKLIWDEKVRYAVYQLEKGDQGTPHYQGYIEFDKPSRMPKKLIPGAHFEARKGTRDQARAYCMKDESRVEGPFEYGEWIEGQGARSDIHKMVQTCKKGTTKQELIEEHTEVYAKYPRFVELCKRTYAKKRDPANEMNVVCYWGKSGCGKTRKAVEEFAGKPYYMKTPTTKDWWDGYDGEEHVIIDEADKGYLKLCEMLSILDRYPCKVNVKGDVMEFTATSIILTANKHPELWYTNCSTEERRGIIRRINRVECLSALDEEPDLLDL